MSLLRIVLIHLIFFAAPAFAYSPQPDAPPSGANLNGADNLSVEMKCTKAIIVYGRASACLSNPDCRSLKGMPSGDVNRGGICDTVTSSTVPSATPATTRSLSGALTGGATPAATTPHTTGGATTPKNGGSGSTTQSKSASTPNSNSGTSGGAVAVAPTSGNASSDMSTCRSMAESAISCCTNPSSCASLDSSSMGLSSGGLTDTCKQMQGAGMDNARSNQEASAQCTQRYLSCVETCNNFSRIHSDQSSAFRSTASRCQGLSQLALELNSQGQSSFDSSQAGTNCNNMGSASPQSAGGGGGGSGSGSGNGMNPNSADPYGNSNQQSASAAGDPSTGEGGYQAGNRDGSRGGRDSFNMADSRDAFGGGGFNGVARDEQAGKNIPQVRPPPNNTGGGLPGQDGSSTSAKLGPSGQKGGPQPDSAYNPANMEMGFRSGGYSGSAGASDFGDGNYGDGGGDGRAPANWRGGNRNGQAPYQAGLDLKQYLPGGKLDPAGRIGGMRPASDIHGRHVNIWNRISVRMQEKCQLGILADCQGRN